MEQDEEAKQKLAKRRAQKAESKRRARADKETRKTENERKRKKRENETYFEKCKRLAKIRAKKKERDAVKRERKEQRRKRARSFYPNMYDKRLSEKKRTSFENKNSSGMFSQNFF